MKAQVQKSNDGQATYIKIWCPGCEYEFDGEMHGGLLMLPVSGTVDHRQSWDWNGSLETVTLMPSILNRTEHTRRMINGESVDTGLFVCHSFLTNGVWRFLDDCTHALKGQSVPMVDLPDWVVKE